MIKIREAIVVEGRYDKNTLSQIVDAPIFQTGGFQIYKDKAHSLLINDVPVIKNSEFIGNLRTVTVQALLFAIFSKAPLRSNI